MNTSPIPSAAGRRSADDNPADRNEIELDVIFALEPLDEAIDAAFLAIKGAQQAARSSSDTTPSGKLRDEWRTHNVLVRQTLRLIDERVQELTRVVKRLPRIG